MKKTYSGIFTLIFFTLLTSAIVPVAAIDNKVSQVTEDFSVSPTPKGAVKAASTSPSALPTVSTKTTIYKGDVSATPSAIGKFLVKTDEGDKNVDTDKKTKVYSFDTGKRVATTVSKLKVSDKVVIVGNMTSDNKSLLASYVLVFNKKVAEPTKNAMYGTVSSREASGSAFTLVVKSPSKDETTSFLINSSTSVKVKDLENPKLSDIKIGDRVTLIYTIDGGVNTVTKIFAIPGRASGLLREIRESSGSASTSPVASPSPSVKGAATTKTSSPSATAKSTVKPSATVKTSATPKATQ